MKELKSHHHLKKQQLKTDVSASKRTLLCRCSEGKRTKQRTTVKFSARLQLHRRTWRKKSEQQSARTHTLPTHTSSTGVSICVRVFFFLRWVILSHVTSSSGCAARVQYLHHSSDSRALPESTAQTFEQDGSIWRRQMANPRTPCWSDSDTALGQRVHCAAFVFFN